MKILHHNPRTGEIRLVPETEDDLWVLYTVISPGDIVIAKTTRDVKFGEGRSRRVPMTLTLRVKSVDFEPFTTRLRIHGIVEEGPERFGVKGSHHTFRIDLGNELTIVKEKWSKPLLEKIMNASKRGLKAIVVALDYDEYAIAMVQEQGVRYVSEGSLGLPGKEDLGYDKVLERELVKLSNTIIDLARRENVNTVIVASPGDLKNKVKEYIKEKNPRIHVYTDTVSIGGRSGVFELLRRDVVREVLKDVSSIEAEKILDEFMRLLVKDEGRIAYGVDDVEHAAKLGAVEELLVLDEVLRSYNVEERLRIEEILAEVDKHRGRVRIVSSKSPAGERLRDLGGIIAILRFKVK